MSKTFSTFAVLSVCVLLSSPLVSTSAEMKVEVLTVYWRSAVDLVESVSMAKSERGKVVAAAATNSLIVRDYPQNIVAMRELLKELDLKRRQARISVSFIEKEQLEKLGVDISWQISGKGWSVGNLPPGWSGGNALAVSAGGEKGKIERGNRQNLLIMEGAEGSIFVGSEIPYAERLVSYSERERYVAVGTVFKVVGISFSVIPRVLDDNMVELQIVPRMSVINRDKGKSDIFFSKASTIVTLKNRESVLIAGNESESLSIVGIFLSGYQTSGQKSSFAILLSVAIE